MGFPDRKRTVWALYLLLTLLAYSLQKHHQPFKKERRTSWGGDVSDRGRWRCGCGRRMRAADTMNATESSFLITQALTIGIGGLYIFGHLNDKKQLKNWDDWLSKEGLVVRPCATIFRYYPTPAINDSCPRSIRDLKVTYCFCTHMHEICDILL